MPFRLKVERSRRRQEAEPLEGCQLILTLCHTRAFYSAMSWQQWIANISFLIRSVRSSSTRKRSRLPRCNKKYVFSVYAIFRLLLLSLQEAVSMRVRAEH